MSANANEDRMSQGESPVSVLVVDDQASFRRALREVVDATEGLVVVGEAASGEESLDAAAELAPGMVIIDKRMPGMGGIEACRRLTARHPDLVVLLVSREDPDPAVASSCGAAAFVTKRDLTPRLLMEVWRAHGPG